MPPSVDRQNEEERKRGEGHRARRRPGGHCSARNREKGISCRDRSWVAVGMDLGVDGWLLPWTPPRAPTITTSFEHNGGWIRALLEEAENERMHLMTFMEVAKLRWYERTLVLADQRVFFNAYFLSYLLFPKLAHRVVGYLEEEAIHSYTEYLKDIEAGKIENVPMPPIAIDYWRLPADATLKDVAVVVRADEAHHRDVNHFASDVHFQGMDLKDTPAPLDYH
ncbi:ubiquinol oxidase 1c, mitochondrial-like [Oryza glaberrima]|uniref:ubiquinol oxidase 1c, mitochondrial-like n=1 Tax=Oryza glaberrima TaxID=4538 RepID=UPI00224C2BC8|nr:ubiquinol oxidase 1c, mitochondrial-like [Oryza glaberrima]